MKVEVKEAYAYEGQSVEYTGEDGYPTGYCMPNLLAIAKDGRYFALPQSFKLVYDEDGFGPYPRVRFTLEDAEEIAAKIYERGFIESEYWMEVDPEEGR